MGDSRDQNTVLRISDDPRGQAALTNPRTHQRAAASVEAMHASTKQRAKGSSRTRGARRLVMVEEPEAILDGRMVPIGIRCFVHLFENGEQVHIDPVREFVNPPLAVVVAPAPRDELGRATGPPQLEEDPVKALWEALWDQVEVAPNPDGWREL